MFLNWQDVKFDPDVSDPRKKTFWQLAIHEFFRGLTNIFIGTIISMFFILFGFSLVHTILKDYPNISAVVIETGCKTILNEK